VIGNIRPSLDTTTEIEYGEEVVSPFDVNTGATDCKNNLLGVMEALEFLVANDFKPKRTIVAGFGFDEEIRYSHYASL
jgi:hypothetical protein